MTTMDSKTLLKQLWLCWTILGISIKNFNIRSPHLLYSIIMNAMVSFCFPIHMLLAPLSNEMSQAEIIKHLANSVIFLAGVIKFIIYATSVGKLHRVEALLEKLDARAHSADEHRQFQQMSQSVRSICYIFLTVYSVTIATYMLAAFLREGRQLLFPAWLPYNWNGSILIFYATICLQTACLVLQMVQAYVSDILPLILLYLLSGHIKLLSIRLSQIGYDKRNVRENERQLQVCILDHQHLYKLYGEIQEIISLPLFVQFTATSFVIGFSMAALIYYTDGSWDRLFYSTLLLAVLLQIFPTCYYGNELEVLFKQLPYAAFSSNWMDQSRAYKKLMITFSERCHRQTTALAGGLVRINLETFIATCKSAYSLFTLVMCLSN